MSGSNNLKIIIGIVGFRCCGKSTLRKILDELSYPVFNTNSVSTGDADANQIPLDQILERYGKNNSYLLFIAEALKNFIKDKEGIIFIDSFKIATDSDTIKEMFPDYAVNIWYLHASNQTRLSRYIDRDIKTNFRTQNLDEHDASLEQYGIWNLIKSANEILNMELEIPTIKKEVENMLSRTLKHK